MGRGGDAHGQLAEDLSTDPAIGFFAQRAAAAVHTGRRAERHHGRALGAASEDARQILVNTTVDGVLSILFAVMIIIIVIADASRGSVSSAGARSQN